MSTSEEQGWVPATYLEAQNGTRDDSDINTSKTGEGEGLRAAGRWVMKQVGGLADPGTPTPGPGMSPLLLEAAFPPFSLKPSEPLKTAGPC